MTLRPIEPIDIRGLTPKKPDTGTPIFEYVDPRTLWVDPAYQRSLSERSNRMLRRIIEEFDWTKLKPPVCAFGEDENGQSKLRVLDGQHTAIAAASNPHVATIPVMIVEAPDTRSQAEAFLGQNTGRLGVTATQLHVAAVAAGNEDALRVADLCEKSAVNLLRGPRSGGAFKPGDTVAVAAIGVLLKREGEVHAGQVLRILSAAGLAPIKADHIKAVDHLLSEPEFGSLDVDALAGSILGYPAAPKDAAAFAATHGLPLWKAIASVWFQKAKKRKPGQEPNRPARGDVASLAPPEGESGLPCDPRAARGAWAPGNHFRRCAKCENGFRGGRLAVECADCAYAEPTKIQIKAVEAGAA